MLFYFRQTIFYDLFSSQKFTSTKMNFTEKRDTLSDKIAQTFPVSIFQFSAESLQIQE